MHRPDGFVDRYTWYLVDTRYFFSALLLVADSVHLHEFHVPGELKEPLSRGAQGISNGLVTVWAFIAAPAACATAKLKHLVRHSSPTCCSLVLLSWPCRH